MARRDWERDYEGQRKNVMLFITDKEKEEFDSVAAELGLTRSDFAVKIGRKIIPLGEQTKEVVLLVK